MSQLQLLLWMFFVVWIVNCDTSNRYSFSTDPPDHPNLDVQLIRNTEIKSYDPLVHSETPSSKIPIKRFRRNAPTDNIQKLLEKSSILAHIANGITLQIDIMKGSIQAYRLISELLNFGDVSYDDVKNFNAAHVNTLAKKLKGLPTSVDDSVKKLEDSTLAWNRRRIESEAIKSGLDDKKVEEYFDELKKFNSSFDFGPISLAYRRLKDIVTILEGIETFEFDATSDNSKSMATTKFTPLVSHFQSAIEGLEKMSSAKTNILNYEGLMQSETIFAPIKTVIKFIVDRMKLREKSNSETIAQFKKNFQQVDELNTASENCNDGYTLITKLAKNRLSENRKEKVFTNGFINGISDVEQLTAEIISLEIKEIADKKVPLEKLFKSMQPLFNLASNISGINNRLKPAITNDSFESMNQLGKLKEIINRASKDSQSLADFLQEIDNCAKKALDIRPSDYKNSQNTIERMDFVGKTIISFKTSLHKLNTAQQQTDFNDFITFLGFKNIEDNLNSKEEVAGVMEKIKKSDDFGNFKHKIINLANELNTDNLDVLKRNISEILSAENKTTFDGLEDELKIYDCLRNHKDKMEQIAAAIEITKALREVKVADVQNVETWANAVASVSLELPTLVDEAAKMKSSPSPEAAQLSSFPFPPQVDDTIITSVNSLRSALELKQMKNSIPVLEAVGSVFVKEMNTITDPNEKKEVENEWGNHTEDISSLEP